MMVNGYDHLLTNKEWLCIFVWNFVIIETSYTFSSNTYDFISGDQSRDAFATLHPSIPKTYSHIQVSTS